MLKYKNFKNRILKMVLPHPIKIRRVHHLKLFGQINIEVLRLGVQNLIDEKSG